MTKGRLIGGSVSQSERERYEHILRSNARVLFAPGDVAVSSELVTILPGNVGIVRSYNFSEEKDEVVVYGVSVNHADYTGEFPSRSTDLNDFSHSNGVSEMSLGGNVWKMDMYNPALVITLPGSYQFVVSNETMLDTLRVEIDIMAAKDTATIPNEYMAGVVSGL